jgi:Fe-S cluster assembly iron-binding protein IscA
MLTLTDEAADVIREIVAEGELGPNSGLRISGTSDGNGESALEFELADEPADGDEVIRVGQAVVFLDETAAAVLADKTLNVHAHGDHYHFEID